MPGVKVAINTADAERALIKLRDNLEKTGVSAILTEKDMKLLEQRMAQGLGTSYAVQGLQGLQSSCKLTHAELMKLQIQSGNVGGAFVTMGQGINSLISRVFSLKAAIVGLGVGMTFKNIMGEFEKFETRLIDTQRVTEKSMQEIRDEIMAQPVELGKPSELVGGFYQTMSAGITDAANAMEIMTAAAKTSQSAHVDQEEIIKGLTALIFGYDGAIKSATEAADLLFQIESKGKAEFRDLIPVIGEVATISRIAGASQYEMAAALAQITNLAPSTAEAATQLKGMMRAISGKPNEAMLRVFKQMNQELGGTYKTMSEIIKEKGLFTTLKMIEKAAYDVGESLESVIPRIEGGLGFRALQAGNWRVEDMVPDMAKTGVMEKVFTDWQKGMEAQRARMANVFGKLAVEIGEKMGPGILSVLGSITTATEKMLPHMDRILGIMEGMAKAGAVFVAGWIGINYVIPALGVMKTLLLDIIYTSVGKLAVDIAVVNGELVIMNRNLGIMAGSWAATTAGIKATMAAVLTLSGAVSLVTSLFVGWQIGKMLWNNFGEVQAFGYQLIYVFKRTTLEIGYLWDMMGLGMAKAIVFLGDTVTKAFGGLMNLLAKGAEAAGFDKLADKLRVDVDAGLGGAKLDKLWDDRIAKRRQDVEDLRTIKDELIGSAAEEFAGKGAAPGAPMGPKVPLTPPSTAPLNAGWLTAEQIEEARKAQEKAAKEAAKAAAAQLKVEQEATEKIGQELAKSAENRIKVYERTSTEIVRIQTEAMRDQGLTYQADLVEVSRWMDEKKKAITKATEEYMYDEMNRMEAVGASLEHQANFRIQLEEELQEQLTKIDEAGAIKRAAAERKAHEDVVSTLGDMRYAWEGYADVKEDNITRSVSKLREAGVSEAVIDAWVNEQRKKDWIEANNVILKNTGDLTQALKATWTNYILEHQTLASELANSTVDIFESMTDTIASNFADFFVGLFETQKNHNAEMAAINKDYWDSMVQELDNYMDYRELRQMSGQELENALTQQIMELKSENLSTMTEDEVRAHDESLARLEDLRSNYEEKMGAISESTKGLGAYFKGFWTALGQQIIQMLIKVGLQHMVLWGLERVLGIQKSMMRMGQLTAETFAAAFASTAAIPIIGPEIAPAVAAASTATMLAGAGGAAAMGAAFGASTGAIGAAAGGLEDVPETGTYILHKGERVVQPEQNVALTKFLEAQTEKGGSGKSVTIESITVEVSFPDITDVHSFLNMDRDALQNAVAEAISQGVRRGIIKGVEVSV